MAVPSNPNQAPTLPGDQANAVIAGSFGATGVSGEFLVYGPFNIFIYGSGGPNGSWNGSVQLERSFDGGTTWIVCCFDGGLLQAIWNTNNQDVSTVGGEVEKGMLYRLHCTAYTSGTINYRLSTTGQAAVSLSVGTSL